MGESWGDIWDPSVLVGPFKYEGGFEILAYI